MPSFLFLDQNNQLLYVSDENHLIRRLSPRSSSTSLVDSSLKSSSSNSPVPLYTLGYQSLSSSSSSSSLLSLSSSQENRSPFNSPPSSPAPNLPRVLVENFAGNGKQGYANGDLLQSEWHYPYGMTMISNGNLLVVDARNHVIREINMKTGKVSTFCGQPGAQGSHLDGDAANARFNNPSGITYDSNRKAIFVADSKNHLIRRIDEISRNVTTVAGTGSSGNADGNGRDARFYYPFGITCDPANGNLYVTDRRNHSIRKVDSEWKVTTIAGGMVGFNDGDAKNSKWNMPSGIEYDQQSRSLFVADCSNHRIRRINLRNSTVETIAGDGSDGMVDGEALKASFSLPYGVSMDVKNRIIYVADTGNSRIRSIRLALH